MPEVQPVLFRTFDSLHLIEQFECVLKRAGKELPLQVYGKKTRAGVDVLVARHAVCSIISINVAMLIQTAGWGKMRG